MVSKQIEVDYLKTYHNDDCELTLDSFSGGESYTIKHLLYSDGSHSIGYISYDDSGKIWSLEVFPKHRGNDYGRVILKDYIQSSDLRTHVLSPISEELVSYYETIGFRETSDYESYLSEFPLMELNV